MSEWRANTVTVEEEAVDHATILIVDDQEPARRLLSRLVGSLGHAPFLAETGMAALREIRKGQVDLVLLDVMMPVMDGLDVLRVIKHDEEIRNVPVIMVSGQDETKIVAQCVRAGADDYVTKPFNATLLAARINASLEKKRLHDHEKQSKTLLEEQVRQQVQEISSAQLTTIFALSKLSESRDPDTGEHLERMREYARIIVRRLGSVPKYSSVVDAQFVENIYAAAPLHDVGKVGIPDRILLKPGKLTAEEFSVMTLHTTIGADTLRAVHAQHTGNAFIRLGIEIAESHHEKWNGTGYPHGLTERNTPLSGRILALADVYDALTSKRCYKDAFGHEESKAIIEEGRAEHFDPDIVDAFLAAETEFVAVRRRFQDSEKVLLQ